MGNITQTALGKLAHDPFGERIMVHAHHPNGARSMSYDAVETSGHNQIAALNMKGRLLTKAVKATKNFQFMLKSKLSRHFKLPKVLPGRWYL